MVVAKKVKLSQKLNLLRGVLINNNAAYDLFVEFKGIKILYYLFA